MQEILISIVLFLAVALLGMRVYKSTRNFLTGRNSCENCTQECEIHRLMAEKRKECNANAAKKKKTILK
jgi:hypothetical protein